MAVLSKLSLNETTAELGLPLSYKKIISKPKRKKALSDEPGFSCILLCLAFI
jgi:hypothetical protein